MKVGGPRVSVIVPAHHEGDAITVVIDRLLELVRLSCEVLVVVDDASDSTVPRGSGLSVQRAEDPLPDQHLRPGPGQRDQVRDRRRSRAGSGSDDGRRV